MRSPIGLAQETKLIQHRIYITSDINGYTRPSGLLHCIRIYQMLHISLAGSGGGELAQLVRAWGM